MPGNPGVETVVRQRLSGAPGRHGAEAPRDDLVIEGCALLPRTATPRPESPDPNDNTVIVGLTLFAPGGTDIDPTDEIAWQGKTYEVEGEPGDYRKRGKSRVIVAALLRVR